MPVPRRSGGMYEYRMSNRKYWNFNTKAAGSRSSQIRKNKKTKNHQFKEQIYA